jgi:hypothetical protein
MVDGRSESAPGNPDFIETKTSPPLALNVCQRCLITDYRSLLIFLP